MYKLTNSNTIIRLTDNAFIPMSTGNSDYKEYLKWVAVGNTPAPADPLPKTPLPALSAWQVRKVLTRFNLRSQVETAVANASQETKDAWQYANEFRRDDVLLNTMGLSLGMTVDQMDQLFIIGITL